MDAASELVVRRANPEDAAGIAAVQVRSWQATYQELVPQDFLAVIYLLPEVWGMGLGQRLMAVALDSLTAAGYAEAMLWVHRSNDRARRFYGAGGWTEDGGVQDDTSHGFLISEVRYRKALPATRELSDDAN
jgi:GNAT superfamily N-acetyltransferase